MKAIGENMLNIPKNISIQYLNKEVEASDESALETVLKSDNLKERLDKESEELTDKLEQADESELDEINEKLSKIYEQLDELELEDSNSRACSILNGLQFSQEMMDRRCKEFSGGWRMRISLACALFMQPTLLLLDEPTNHLDMEAVVWLENYLSQWKHCLVIISHSQDFMNSVCHNTIHLSSKKLKY